MIRMFLLAIVFHLVVFSVPLLTSGSPQFTASELVVIEGANTAVNVELNVNTSGIRTTSLKVHATTLKQYSELRNSLCPLSLTEIGLNYIIAVDAAEDSDLRSTEYDLQFIPNEYHQSFSLEVIDDEISEKEEWFILYLNATSNRCAVKVKILDNDRLQFNFSLPSVIMRGNFNGSVQLRNDLLFINKIGRNEPNVTFEVQVYPAANYNHLPQREFTFTTDVNKIFLPIVVDDNVIESTETFRICLPRFTLNLTVSPIGVAETKCVNVSIYDNDVQIGFQRSYLVLREGAEPQTICVSVLQGHLENQVYLRLTKSVQPLVVDTTDFILSGTNREHCFVIKYLDDDVSNNNVDATVSLVLQAEHGLLLSPGIIHVSVLDDDVIRFYDPPKNVSSVINGEAFFPCGYNETVVIPAWRITSSDGVSRTFTHNTLPRNHFYNSTGLLLTEVTPNQNLTMYSCFFRLFIAGPYEITSSSGTLMIMTPIKFELTGKNMPENIKELFLREGDSTENLIKIVRKDNTDLTFNISLLFKPIQGNFSDSYHIFFSNTSYIFYPNTTEVYVSIPFKLTEDSIPEIRKIFCLSVAEPIQIIEDNNITLLNPAIAGSSLNISIYDNDYIVGFTNSSIIVNEGESIEVCVSFLIHPHEIDPMSYILLEIEQHHEQLLTSSGYILKNPIYMTLSKMNGTSCVNIDSSEISSTYSSNGVNVYTLEISIINSTAHTVHIECKYSIVIIMKKTLGLVECISIAIIINIVVVLSICLLISIIFCLSYYSNKKNNDRQKTNAKRDKVPNRINSDPRAETQTNNINDCESTNDRVKPVDLISIRKSSMDNCEKFMLTTNLDTLIVASDVETCLVYNKTHLVGQETHV